MKPLTYLINCAPEGSPAEWHQSGEEFKDSEDVIAVIAYSDYQAKRLAELEIKKIDRHELTDKELSDQEYIKGYIESMNDSFDESIKYQTDLKLEIESLRKQLEDYEFRFGILKQIDGIRKVIGS